MNVEIEKILWSASEISERLDALAGELLATWPEEEERLVVIVMTGAVVFASDLLRRVPRRMRWWPLVVSSYCGEMEAQQEPRISRDDWPELRGESVLVLDDILDTGKTLLAVTQALKEAGAKSIQTCVCLSKRGTRRVAMEADHVALLMDDEFVVGYGLDYLERYRELPYLGVLKNSET